MLFISHTAISMLKSAFYFQEAVDIVSILYAAQDLTSTYYILNMFRWFIYLLFINVSVSFVTVSGILLLQNISTYFYPISRSDNIQMADQPNSGTKPVTVKRDGDIILVLRRMCFEGFAVLKCYAAYVCSYLASLRDSLSVPFSRVWTASTVNIE
jgi:hypothetical protein